MLRFSLLYCTFSQNVAANHRANDVIVREGAPQVLVARFMYSPIDMITLTGMIVKNNLEKLLHNSYSILLKFNNNSTHVISLSTIFRPLFSRAC